MSDHHASRRDRLAAQLRPAGLAALLVTNPVNVTYLTGFSGDSTYLLLSPGKALAVSDGRYTTQLAEECPGLDAHIRPPGQTLQQAAAEVVAASRLSPVGFEPGHLTVADFQTLADATPAVQWQADPGRAEKLRMVKDDGELACIRESIDIAQRVFAVLRASLRGRDTEKELADSIELHVRRLGGSTCSFPPIVAAGPRAALPHAVPTDAPVGGADFLLVDWGATGRSYKSDLTRVLVRRSVSDTAKIEKVYNTVLRAQQAAVARLRPGVKAGEVDAAARGVITDAGYGEQFTHSTGHGFGLQIHEGPMLRPGSELVLEAGMVTTIEPGIYIPGWGGVRLEDDVLITPDGPELLTSVPREFADQFADY